MLIHRAPLPKGEGLGGVRHILLNIADSRPQWIHS